MSENVVKKDLPIIEGEIDQLIADYRTALEANNFKAMTSIEEDLKKAEADYASAKRDKVFAQLRETGAPVLEGIKLYEYETIGHRVEKDDDGSPTGLQKTIRLKQVDLVKLCKFCNISDVWKYKVERMNLLLATRAAKELGYEGAELKKFVDSWFLSDLAKREKMGETPMSNAQCVKMLQSVVDAILPDGGYKVNNYDVSFLLRSHTERDKRERHTVKVIKGAHLHNVLLDVLNRVVTGGVYKVKPPKLSKGPESAGAVKGEDKTAEPKAKKSKKATKAAEPQVFDVPAEAAPVAVEVTAE